MGGGAPTAQETDPLLPRGVPPSDPGREGSKEVSGTVDTVDRLLQWHAPTIALGLVVLAGWWLAARSVSDFLLPSPLAVATSFLRVLTSAVLWVNAWATLWRISVGFLAALVLALTLGFTATRFRATRQLLHDVTTILNSISVFVWIVLAVVWFGLGNTGPVFTTLMITLPILLATVLEGVDAVDRGLLAMGEVYRFSSRQSFLHITLPGTVPYLVAGMKVAFAIGLKVSVVAELFGVASGVGYQMNLARERLATADVFVWAIVLILVMVAVDKGLFAVLTRRVDAWR